MNIGSTGVNWVDAIIVVILIYFIVQALSHGFWVVLADFFAFLGALLIALLGYQYTAEFLSSVFNISHSLSHALGFLLTAIVSEAVLGFLFGKLIIRLPSDVRGKVIGRYVGIVPALGTGLILISFILILATALPISPKVKVGISDSTLGNFILSQTSGVETRLNDVFNGVVEDSLTHLVIKPGSEETVPLEVDRFTLSVDRESEQDMLKLVNTERFRNNLKDLEWSEDVAEVAREYAKEMWNEEYFGHISPNGFDVGDRLEAVDIKFTFAGENLALSPTVKIAHSGLMNSQGHRENILEKDFRKVGIGAVDNGVYGKIFVQVFTD